MPLMNPTIEWTETAGDKYGGRFHSPQEIVRGVFAKVPEVHESFSVEIDRLIDAGDDIVMQGHCPEGTSCFEREETAGHPLTGG